MGRYIDITGQRFGKLTAIRHVGRYKKNTMWECKCDCGNTTITAAKRLKNGTSKSCGCLRMANLRRKTIHGMYNTRLHKEWGQMKFRGSNKKWAEADRYANRGITVCEEWEKSFIPFMEWALANGYEDGLSLDRIDNDKGYSPDNCRWADRKTQNRNKGCNVLLEYNGEKKPISEWAEILGIKYGTLYSRLKRGKWSIKDAFERPLRKW